MALLFIAIIVLLAVVLLPAYFEREKLRSTSSSHDELTDIDGGDLIVTNQRLFFVGKQRTTNALFKKILSIEAYPDSIVLHKDGRERAQYFLWPTNLLKLNGATDAEPLTGAALQALINNQLAMTSTQRHLLDDGLVLFPPRTTLTEPVTPKMNRATFNEPAAIAPLN